MGPRWDKGESALAGHTARLGIPGRVAATVVPLVYIAANARDHDDNSSGPVPPLVLGSHGKEEVHPIRCGRGTIGPGGSPS